jgi:hypothetical protein
MADSSKSKRLRRDHFWEALERAADGCWLWRGSRNRRGYGSIWDGERFRLTHRFAWTAARGPIPPGMVVCHACDVPSCCNPAHLFLGTQSENVKDSVAKGRWTGMAGKRSFDRDALRREYTAGGVTQEALAAKYGTTQSHVSRVLSGKR